MKRLLATIPCSSMSALRYPYTLATLLFLAAFSVFFCSRQLSDWDQHYRPAAARLAAGGDIYQGGFVYPPINAWVALPFMNLPHAANRLAWFGISAVGLVVLVGGGWRLSGGGRLQGTPPVARAEHLIFGLGLLCGVFYAVDTLTNQQNDLVVAALVIGACLALVAKRDLWSGVLFGLAAGIKCTPLLWAPYLAWRGRWRAALLVPVVALAINLVPDLTHPTQSGQPWLATWAHRYLKPMAQPSHDFGTWAAAINFNHSLAGASNRWLTYETALERGDVHFEQRTERLSGSMLKVVGLGSMALFVLAALVCTGWPGHRVEDSGAPPTQQALEFSMVLILMLLLSPHSSKPHFCTLMLPGFCLARVALARADRWLLVLLVLTTSLTTLVHKDLVGRILYGYFMWVGVPTLVASLLFAGCCWALLRRPAGTTTGLNDDRDALPARLAA